MTENSHQHARERLRADLVKAALTGSSVALWRSMASADPAGQARQIATAAVMVADAALAAFDAPPDVHEPDPTLPAVALANEVLRICRRGPAPVLHNAAALAEEVLANARHGDVPDGEPQARSLRPGSPPPPPEGPHHA